MIASNAFQTTNTTAPMPTPKKGRITVLATYLTDSGLGAAYLCQSAYPTKKEVNAAKL